MPQIKRQLDFCLWVRGFLVVSFETLLNQFRLRWKYVKVGNHEQQAFFVQIKENLHLLDEVF
jgi:hypothetical protein